MIRRLATFVVVAGATTFGLVAWLEDGDLAAASGVFVDEAARWDADALARAAGVPVVESRAVVPTSAPAQTAEDPPSTP